MYYNLICKYIATILTEAFFFLQTPQFKGMHPIRNGHLRIYMSFKLNLQVLKYQHAVMTYNTKKNRLHLVLIIPREMQFQIQPTSKLDSITYKQKQLYHLQIQTPMLMSQMSKIFPMSIQSLKYSHILSSKMSKVIGPFLFKVFQMTALKEMMNMKRTQRKMMNQK